MGTFAYRALDFQGGSTQGQLDAGGKQAVTDLLRQKGLIALDITEVEPETKGDILSRFKRIKSDELTIATRQLATMVSSGMSLLRALYVLEELGDNAKLKEALVKVRTDVEGGSGLS